MGSRIQAYYVRCNTCQRKLDVGFASTPEMLVGETGSDRQVQCPYCGSRVAWGVGDLFTE